MADDRRRQRRVQRSCTTVGRGRKPRKFVGSREYASGPRLGPGSSDYGNPQESPRTPGRHETSQGPVGLPFPRCSRSHLRAPSRVVFRPSFTRRAFLPKSRWCSCSRRSGLFVIPTWIVFLFLTMRYFVVSRSEDITYSLRAVRLVQRPYSSGRDSQGYHAIRSRGPATAASCRTPDWSPVMHNVIGLPRYRAAR